MLQSSPASRSALAWPAISVPIAASDRRATFWWVRPWRRSTALACASRLSHAWGSLGSTGWLPARRTSAVQLRLSSALSQRGKHRCSWRAASVLRAWAISRSRSPSPRGARAGRPSARPEPLVAAAAAAAGAGVGSAMLRLPFCWVKGATGGQGGSRRSALPGPCRGAGRVFPLRVFQRVGASAASFACTSAASSARTCISASPSRFWPPRRPCWSRHPTRSRWGSPPLVGGGASAAVRTEPQILVAHGLALRRRDCLRRPKVHCEERGRA